MSRKDCTVGGRMTTADLGICTHALTLMSRLMTRSSVGFSGSFMISSKSTDTTLMSSNRQMCPELTTGSCVCMCVRAWLTRG